MKQSTIRIINLVLVIPIVVLTYLLVTSIMKPVLFKEEVRARNAVAIQRLKDIRELQVAYKTVHGEYASTMVALQKFYNEGKMSVEMNVGSKDDSLAMANTARLRKSPKYRRFNDKEFNAELKKLYDQGEKDLVFTTITEVDVKKTVLADREDFIIDSIAFIPFSGGDSVLVAARVTEVGKVKVPLFEANMPYWSLYKGLDEQEIANLIYDKCQSEIVRKNLRNTKEGLRVGDVNEPNNNAGNWENIY